MAGGDAEGPPPPKPDAKPAAGDADDEEENAADEGSKAAVKDLQEAKGGPADDASAKPRPGEVAAVGGEGAAVAEHTVPQRGSAVAAMREEITSPAYLEKYPRGMSLAEASPAQLTRPELLNVNLGRSWWDKKSWNTWHTETGLDFRKKHHLGSHVYSNTYFGPEYERNGLGPGTGAKARPFPQPHPMDRFTRYTTKTPEGKFFAYVEKLSSEGKSYYFTYTVLAATLVYHMYSASRVSRVPLPDDLQPIDNGTGTSYAVGLYLPDWKLFDVLGAEKDGYLKKYVATTFSCAHYFLPRKLYGFLDSDFYGRPYHFHYRRRVEKGELFSDFELERRSRTTALLRSQLFGSIAHCRAEVDDQGILRLQLSSILPDDHWSQRWNGSLFGDYLLSPAYTAVNKLVVRHWFSSTINYFLRNHCSEVYVKPINAGNTGAWDFLA